MSNTPQQTTQAQALAYHANNYVVMPCKKDKRPALTSWKYLQTERPTDDDILKWFAKGDRNIGIVTGHLSNLTVIDIDTKGEGGQERADDMLKKFPETRTIQTPSKGYHLYYQDNPDMTISTNAYPNFPNVDIRGESGFVIAPPSTTDKGEYKVIKDIPIAPFPTALFPTTKPRKTLTEKLTAKNGSRNDSLASFAGQLLQSELNEDKWITEVLPAVQRANKTYTPQLPDDEVLTVFNSIAKKERTRRQNLALSPIGQVPNITTTKGGIPHQNMSNVVAILEAHADFRDKIRYNTFRQEIEINGIPVEDNDILKVQYILQTKFGLHNISKDAVFSALMHCAYENKYDEAQDWLTALKWDKTPRLFTWLTSATGVESNEYTRGVGTQWFIQMANRIMNPGCIADYMLVLVGGQGIGKTSLFRIIGGKWYKSFSGSVENKDFYLALRGAVIIDLDEGATLYKAEVLKLKTMITQTEDEFRAPYDRVPKKFPRRFVFSMSTNEIEPFVDATGNRRYWPVDIEGMVDFKWLEENRDQLFAEAYYWLKNKSKEIPEVPKEEAQRIQQDHLPADSWTDVVMKFITKSYEYCEGDPNFSITVEEVFLGIFEGESLLRLNKKEEMRIGNVLRAEAGMERRRMMIDGDRKYRYYITDKKLAELQAKHKKQYKEPIDVEFPDEVQSTMKF